MSNETNRVLIYRDKLLASSQTFIREQAEAMTGYTPFYIGTRKIKGLNLPKERVITINKGTSIGWVREASFKALNFAPFFYSKLNKLNPALIHAHLGPDGVWALPIAQKLGIPSILTFHGYDATIKDEAVSNSSFRHRAFLKNRAKLAKEIDLFIAVSNHIKKKLVEQGFLEEKIIVHHIGVNINKFEVDKSIEREKVVLFVGRMVEKKGVTFLIKAMEKVQEKYSDYKLVLIGDGPLKSELEEEAKSKLKNVEFYGFLDHLEVRKWMNKASILAAPSVVAEDGDSEGLPTVIIEASAMELPIVATYHSGISEAVIHEETGMLSRERDWRGLADNLLLLLNDKIKIRKMGKNAREYIVTNFDIYKQSKKLEKVYRDLASS